jgi:hypothetical protein
MLNIDTTKVMNKEMDRKQFLRNVGIGVIALTGITAALRAIGQISSTSDTSQIQSDGSANSVSAYGGSVYGGSKPRA